MVNGSVLSSVHPSPVLGNSVCLILRGGAVPRFLPFSLPPAVESRVQADYCHHPVTSSWSLPCTGGVSGAGRFHSPSPVATRPSALYRCRNWISYPFPSNSCSYLVLTQSGAWMSLASSGSPSLKNRQALCGHTPETETARPGLLFVLVLSFEHPVEACGRDILYWGSQSF